MRTTNTILLACFFLVFSLLTHSIALTTWETHQIDTFGRSTLTGIKKVTPDISISYLWDQSRNQLNYINELRTDIELQLRKYEVAYSTKDDLVLDDDEGQLIITIQAVKDRPFNNDRVETYVAQVSVEVHQLVSIYRNDTISVCRTWPCFTHVSGRGFICASSELLLWEGIQNDVQSQLKAFINDYLAANLPQNNRLSGLIDLAPADSNKPRLVPDD